MGAKAKPAIATVRARTEPPITNVAIEHQDEVPNAETVESPAATVQESSAITTTTDHPMAVIGGVTTEQLKAALAVQTEQRALIGDFIRQHLVEGTDYGRIHVVKDCPSKYGNCDRDYHYSKMVLFKPGQEKLFSLFQIQDELVRDAETFEMLPEVRNMVAYKCVLTRNGQRVGEGRGSAVVGDKGRDTNSTIKIAEKRARMDACLSLGFSEYFAQDLDDPDYKTQAEMANQQTAARAEAKDKDEFGLMPREASAPINDEERAVLHRLILKAGFADQAEVLELLRINGITEPSAMTSGQARDMMRMISNSTFAAPERAKAHVVTDVDGDPAEALSNAVEALEASAPVPPVELVVDDDLMAHVADDFQSLGLNSRGRMWFMKIVSGKPYASWDKLTDHEWRKAFDLIQDILDSRVEVNPDYMADPSTPTVEHKNE